MTEHTNLTDLSDNIEELRMKLYTYINQNNNNKAIEINEKLNNMIVNYYKLDKKISIK